MMPSIYQTVWLEFIIRTTRLDKMLNIEYKYRPVIDGPTTVSRYSVKTMQPIAWLEVIHGGLFDLSGGIQKEEEE